jgi:hypothetical protein
MTDYLKGLWARLTVHWHVVLAALIAALPSILDYLGVIDLLPILLHLGIQENYANLIVKAMPFVLAFLRPMLTVDAVEPEATE